MLRRSDYFESDEAIAMVAAVISHFMLPMVESSEPLKSESESPI